MNKIFHIGSTFKAFEEDDDLHIAGMASTADTDRVGDSIDVEAWKKGGLDNYLNNPVILFNHDYNQPIGRAVSLGTNDKGLQLKAKIAKSAGHIGELIKEGVLGAFSVGFLVKDADYNKETDGYRIKDAELLEVSVVTVPANQAATFSLAKSFNSAKEYEEFKKSFKEVGSLEDNEPKLDDSDGVKAQEKNMDIDKMVAEAVEKATAAMVMKDAARKAEEEAAKKAAAEARAKEAAQEEVVIKAVQDNTEKLFTDFESKINEKNANFEKVFAEMKTELSEKAMELQQIRDSKRVFADRNGGKKMEDFREEILDAHFLGIITNK
jgi:HK97 family phage prohead protease